MTFALCLLAAYLCGALPWSVWLGRWRYGIDPRALADGNPGASNAFRAAGWRLGVPVLLLDYLKGLAPVAVAHYTLDLPDSQLFWVAIAPTLGHAFSIFLRGRGGRGLTVMFGVWTGLTLYEVPLVMGAVAVIGTRLIKQDAPRSLAVPLAALIYLAARGEPVWMPGVAGVQAVVLALKIGYGWLRGPEVRHAA